MQSKNVWEGKPCILPNLNRQAKESPPVSGWEKDYATCMGLNVCQNIGLDMSCYVYRILPILITDVEYCHRSQTYIFAVQYTYCHMPE